MEVVRLNLDIPIKYTAQLKKYILEKSPYFDGYKGDINVMFNGKLTPAKITLYANYSYYKLNRSTVITVKVQIKNEDYFSKSKNQDYICFSTEYKIEDINEFYIDKYINLNGLYVEFLNFSPTEINELKLNNKNYLIKLKFKHYGLSNPIKNLKNQKDILDKISNENQDTFYGFLEGMLYTSNINDDLELIMFIYVLTVNEIIYGEYVQPKDIDYLKSKLAYFGYDETFEYNEELDIDNKESIIAYLMDIIVNNIYHTKRKRITKGCLKDMFDDYIYCLEEK